MAQAPEDIEVYKRALKRERLARKAAEKILEEKSLELWNKNQELATLNQNLEQQVADRTKDLEGIARFPGENPSPVMRVMPDLSLDYANDAALRLLHSLGHAKGTPAPPEISELVQTAINLRHRLERELKAGKNTFAVTVVPFPDQGYINLYFVDITEKTAAENVLRESEARYRNVVESASDIIYGTDPMGHFLFANQVAERLLNLPADSIAGRHFTELIPEKYREDARVFYRNQLEQRLPETYYEFPVNTANGDRLWLGQHVKTQVDETGAVNGFIAVARDITGQKLAEEKLRQSEERYRSIIESLEFGMMEVDVHGRITRVYEGMCRMTGYTAEELLGKDPSTLLLDPEFLPLMEKQIATRAAGQTSAYEVKMRKKDGTSIWAMISGAPLLGEEGEIAGSIGVHLDLSDRKKIEDQLRVARARAEESARAKEQFLANMSHEIRTPMNGIVGMVRLLEKTALDTTQHKYLETIDSSAGHLLVLINDILDLSKIEAGKLSLEQIPVDVRKLIDSVQNDFRTATSAKNIELRTQIDPSLRFNVLGDPTRLRQILTNLTNNAIKFTERGHVNLTARTINTDKEFALIRIGVSDTGIGIDSERLESVFEAFEQEESTTTRIYGGSGLGLPICKQLVELMGGSIHITSEKYKGTAVWAEIPMKITEEADTTTAANKNWDAAELAGRTVLLAEDHDINRFLAAKLLEDAGLKVVFAENGRQAIERLGQFDIDLILMDMQMPVMDGLDATRHIREHIDATIPIIALTANAIKGDEKRCLDAGMNDYVSKPFEPARLFAAMSDLLGKTSVRTNKTVEASPDEIAASKAAFNPEKLRAMANGDEAFVQRMIKLFLDRTPESMREMHEALEAGDYTTLKKVAHKLKPSFDMLGIDASYRLVRQVEALAAQGDPEHKTPDMLRELQHIISQAMLEMRALLHA